MMNRLFVLLFALVLVACNSKPKGRVVGLIDGFSYGGVGASVGIDELASKSCVKVATLSTRLSLPSLRSLSSILQQEISVVAVLWSWQKRWKRRCT